MKLRVEVTAEDIANGKREDSESCPIALALLRCDGVFGAEVNEDITTVTPDDDRLSGSPPKEASDFIDNFDAGNDVEPFAFEIEVEAPESEEDDDPGDEEVSP